MDDLITAIGLAIALEGAAYALFPRAMKQALLRVLAEPENHIRIAGLIAAIGGVGLVWWIRG